MSSFNVSGVQSFNVESESVFTTPGISSAEGGIANQKQTAFYDSVTNLFNDNLKLGPNLTDVKKTLNKKVTRDVYTSLNLAVSVARTQLVVLYFFSVISGKGARGTLGSLKALKLLSVPESVKNVFEKTKIAFKANSEGRSEKAMQASLSVSSNLGVVTDAVAEIGRSVGLFLNQYASVSTWCGPLGIAGAVLSCASLILSARSLYGLSKIKTIMSSSISSEKKIESLIKLIEPKKKDIEKVANKIAKKESISLDEALIKAKDILINDRTELLEALLNDKVSLKNLDGLSEIEKDELCNTIEQTAKERIVSHWLGVAISVIGLVTLALFLSVPAAWPIIALTAVSILLTIVKTGIDEFGLFEKMEGVKNKPPKKISVAEVVKGKIDRCKQSYKVHRRMKAFKSTRTVFNIERSIREGNVVIKV
jgi:hypothetical protein